MMSIKYEHLLCVSDALGALRVPLAAFAFPLFWFLPNSLQPCVASCLRNQLNNPTDKQPLGHGISVQKIFSTLCESKVQTQLCATELMFLQMQLKGNKDPLTFLIV